MNYLQPLTPEFRINSDNVFRQEDARVVALSNERFLVVWENRVTGETTKEIRQQIFNSDGTAVGESTVVNSVKDIWQAWPAATELADGSYVVTWDIEYAPGFVGDVVARVFNADGSPKGEQFTVNTVTEDDQWGQNIAPLNDGGFAIVWYSKEGDALTRVAKVKSFNADGSPKDEEVVISAPTLVAPEVQQSSTRIVTLSDGRMVATWQEFILDSANERETSSSFARFLTKDGTPMGETFEVLPSEGLTGAFSVTALLRGGFAVAGWRKTGEDLENVVLIQVFDSEGIAKSDPVISDEASAEDYEPSVAATPDGGFVVTKTVDVNGTDAGQGHEYTFLERFDANGERVGEPVQVNEAVGSGTYYDDASVAVLSDGRIVVTMEGKSPATLDVENVYARIFEAKWVGTNGRDDLSATTFDDDMYGRRGNDKMWGLAGDDTIEGGGGFDKLFGGKGKDNLHGNKGNDTLKGQGSNDKLLGGKGADILDGGKGRDQMTGGAGQDVFVFKKGYGKDTVKDFQDDIDTIRLDDALWAGSLSKQQVIDQFANVVGDDIVFDFGTHELKIKGFTDLSELKDDIEFI